MERMIRPSEIEGVTGLSLTTIWRREHEGTFPRRKQISIRRVGWLSSEVEEWLKTRSEAASIEQPQYLKEYQKRKRVG